MREIVEHMVRRAMLAGVAPLDGGEEFGELIGLVDAGQRLQRFDAMLRQHAFAREEREIDRGRTRQLHQLLRTDVAEEEVGGARILDDERAVLQRLLPVGFERFQRVLQTVIEVVVGRMVERVLHDLRGLRMLQVAERDDGFQSNARMNIVDLPGERGDHFVGRHRLMRVPNRPSRGGADIRVLRH